MPYSPTAWINDSAPPIDAANLNNLEDGVSKAPYGPDASSGFVPVGDGSGGWVYEKLPASSLSGYPANAADVLLGDGTWAAIKDAQIDAAAAIALSKLADPGSGKVVTSIGAGALAAFPPGYELVYQEMTTNGTSSATAATAASAVISTSAFTFDGTAVWIEVFFPFLSHSVSGTNIFVSLWNDSTDLGVIAQAYAAAAGRGQQILARRKYTPAAGSHSISVRLYSSAAGTATAAGGSGGSGAFLPGYLRVVKA